MNLHNPVKPLSIGVDEAARLIGVARSMFYVIVKQGEIETFKLGRRRLVLVKTLEAYINRQAKENSR